MSSSHFRGERFQGRIRKVYTAVMTAGGRVLPIVETVGRRVLREIEADSREGARLLAEGRVELWTDGGTRAGWAGTRRSPSGNPEIGLRKLAPGKRPAGS